jgi:4-hydroxybenzoate polyprenyltransferase/phosphoserine phosphatase
MDVNVDAGAVAQRVIVVDLDRTLVRSDTLHEQVVRMIFKHPSLLLGLAGALLKGRVAFKRYCADHIELDPATLHACDEVLGFVRAEKAAGSYLVLCSAADIRVANALARHVGLFDEVMATASSTNLKGAAKAEVLVKRFPQGFIYAGDHEADLAIWSKADGIVLVGVSSKVGQAARTLGKPILADLRPRENKPGSQLRTWAKALRVHHWSKNILMFVPLILAHQWLDFGLVARTCIGFALLLAVTSSSYLINDLADIDADRLHATKRNRPIASGAVPLSQALAVAVVVLPLALILAVLLNLEFAVALAAYLVITLAYSLGLKRIPLLDTFIIGVLFTTRLVMGSTFVGTGLPIWLLTFSMFFFFSLAMAKRHTEVLGARDSGASLAARGYLAGDWPLTLNMGITTGLASLVILVFYLVDEAFKVVGYARPEFLWAVVLFVAIWIGRVWLLTHRGQMNDDPVSFALRDRPSLGIAGVIAILFLIAL